MRYISSSKKKEVQLTCFLEQDIDKNTDAKSTSHSHLSTFTMRNGAEDAKHAYSTSTTRFFASTAAIGCCAWNAGEIWVARAAE
jgi:hypothetical protein